MENGLERPPLVLVSCNLFKSRLILLPNNQLSLACMGEITLKLMVLIERYHYLTFFVCVCWSLHLSQNVKSFFLSDINECQTYTDNCDANAVYVQIVLVVLIVRATLSSVVMESSALVSKIIILHDQGW